MLDRYRLDLSWIADDATLGCARYHRTSLRSWAVDHAEAVRQAWAAADAMLMCSADRVAVSVVALDPMPQLIHAETLIMPRSRAGSAGDDTTIPPPPDTSH